MPEPMQMRWGRLGQHISYAWANTNEIPNIINIFLCNKYSVSSPSPSLRNGHTVVQEASLG